MDTLELAPNRSPLVSGSLDYPNFAPFIAPSLPFAPVTSSPFQIQASTEWKGSVPMGFGAGRFLSVLLSGPVLSGENGGSFEILTTKTAGAETCFLCIIFFRMEKM